MSIAVVTRHQAEEYARQNNITLIEAKEILLEQAQFRIRPSQGYKIAMDQDGFYLGLKRIKQIERFHYWVYSVKQKMEKFMKMNK